MTTEEREELKQAIEKKLTKTEKAIKELEEFTKPVAPDKSYGRLSRLEAMNNKSVMESNLREAQNRLTKLKNALHSIDDPEFGICKVCGNEIPIGRLKVMPESTLCIRCARRQ